MLSQQIANLLNEYATDLEKNKNRDLIHSANTKMQRETQITIKEYDALLSFLSSLIKDQKDQNKKNALLEIKSSLMSLASSNELVSEFYITDEGRMPNASLMIGFIDTETNVAQTILIRNDKFKQFTTPAGKLGKEDMQLKEDGEIDVTKTYENGALREFCEEALSETGKAALLNLLATGKFTINVVNRDALGIPEINKDFDTRLLTLDIGRQSAATIKTWLKTPEPKNADASEAFLQDVPSLARDRLEAVVDGKFTNYFLTRKDTSGEMVRLAVRAPTLITLLGPENDPTLGFAKKIGTTSATHYGYQSSQMQFATQTAATSTNNVDNRFKNTFN